MHRIQAGSSVADVLINEDFESLATGTNDAPDYSVCLSGDGKDGLIDPAYTHGLQWTGYNVYSAGGAVCLKNDNPQNPSYINTPAGDYSGEIKLTFLAKALKTIMPSGSVLSGTSLMVAPISPSGKLDCDASSSWSVRLYEDQGWCEVTLTFNNRTAYNDTYIGFRSSGNVIIDDIRLTAANNEFMAAPVIKPMTNLKADSFTINWEPVRKTFSYYIYLYYVKGYDESGNPILSPIPDPVQFNDDFYDYLSQIGMTIEDYLQGIDEVYWNYDLLERYDETTYTFENLDPEKEYYYAVRTHYVKTFSPLELQHANYVSAPEAIEASEIKEDGFTANWYPAPKATSYNVTLYSSSEVGEDNEEYPILNEDYNKVSDYTTSTDTANPDAVYTIDGFNLDMLTENPGWTASYNGRTMTIVEGMLGFDWTNVTMWSPALDCSGADEVTIDLRVENPYGAFTILVGTDYETLSLSTSTDVLEEKVTLSTHGSKYMKVGFSNNYNPLFIDHFYVTKAVKKGDKVTSWLSESSVDGNESSLSFESLVNFNEYAYSVTAVKGEGKNAVKSEPSNPVYVNLATKTTTDIADIETVNGAEESGRYTLDGRLVAKDTKGMLIIRYNDGSARKVIVK